MIQKIVIFMLTSWILSACSAVKLSVANLPAKISTHYTTYKNISYGENPWQKLDIYTPKNIKNAPVVTFFYGGAWVSGEKSDYAFIANMLTKNGFIVVIPDYRKYPYALYPDFEYDAAQATKWITTNIQKYRGNPQNMHLMGHSAGGHIGMMLICNKEFLKNVGLNHTIYKSFVGISGPYDFEPKEPEYKAVFGRVQNYFQMQASTFIDGTEPTMLLIHGVQDDLVTKDNINKIIPALQKHHNHYIVREYANTGHIDTISTFTGLPATQSRIADDVIKFLHEHSKPL